MTKTHYAKMLALMPVVALVAACSGAVPTSSTDVAAVTAADSGEAAASSLRACGPEAVNLRVDEGDRAMIWVVASYQSAQPGTAFCPAPAWTSPRQDLVVDRANRFRAGFARTAEGWATVTATAPNGVQNSIRVNLGSSLQLTDGTANTAACKMVNSVSLVILPATATGNTRLNFEARYGYSSPVTTACTIAPRWSASRSGLTVANDGFHASISRRTDERQTVVRATAPTGVFGSVTF